MGNTLIGYKNVLIKMVSLAIDGNQFRCESMLKDNTIEELEEIVNNHLGGNDLEKAFFAGFASSEYIQEINEKGCNDELNAFVSSLGMIYDFCGIKEDEDEDKDNKEE